MNMENQGLTREQVIDLAITSKYSVGDQIAIIRQKDTKPEEWAAFNEFAEKVKQSVSAEFAARAAAQAKE